MKHVLWLIGAGALVLVILVVLIGFSPQDQEFVPSDDEAGFQSIVKPCASPDSAPRLPSRRSCKDRSTVRNAHYDPVTVRLLRRMSRTSAPWTVLRPFGRADATA